jgi:hypothetical protein
MKQETFLRNISICDDGCWESNITPSVKYAKIRHNGKNEFAHRYIWEVINGPIPNGLCIRHSCDNTRCVNPDHLLSGTHRDNMHDMSVRGRVSGGCDTKLSKGEIWLAAKLRRAGINTKVIGKMFKVTRQSICKYTKYHYMYTGGAYE